MNGDLTDGTIILMHDIHEPSVKAALRLIPDLIAQGYKLVTVSEMAEAKNVTLQNACYVDFWPSTLSNGDVPGYQGGSDAAASADGTDGTSDASADSSDGRRSACPADLPQTLPSVPCRPTRTAEVMMMEVRMTEVMMMEVQMIRKITVMIL